MRRPNLTLGDLKLRRRQPSAPMITTIAPPSPGLMYDGGTQPDPIASETHNPYPSVYITELTDLDAFNAAHDAGLVYPPPAPSATHSSVGGTGLYSASTSHGLTSPISPVPSYHGHGASYLHTIDQLHKSTRPLRRRASAIPEHPQSPSHTQSFQGSLPPSHPSTPPILEVVSANKARRHLPSGTTITHPALVTVNHFVLALADHLSLRITLSSPLPTDIPTPPHQLMGNILRDIFPEGPLLDTALITLSSLKASLISGPKGATTAAFAGGATTSPALLEIARSEGHLLLRETGEQLGRKGTLNAAAIHRHLTTRPDFALIYRHLVDIHPILDNILATEPSPPPASAPAAPLHQSHPSTHPMGWPTQWRKKVSSPAHESPLPAGPALDWGGVSDGGGERHPSNRWQW